jgi:hypothetical protein
MVKILKLKQTTICGFRQACFGRVLEMLRSAIFTNISQFCKLERILHSDIYTVKINLSYLALLRDPEGCVIYSTSSNLLTVPSEF